MRKIYIEESIVSEIPLIALNYLKKWFSHVGRIYFNFGRFNFGRQKNLNGIYINSRWHQFIFLPFLIRKNTRCPATVHQGLLQMQGYIFNSYNHATKLSGVEIK